MNDLTEVIGSGITRVLTQPYFLGDEDKARQPGSTITITPPHNPKIGGWQIAGYWCMCDDGVRNLLAITEPLAYESVRATTFEQKEFSPGWACFQNGCHYAAKEGDCPECGEEMRRVETLLVWTCSCGWFTFANDVRVNDHKSDQYFNPICCGECGAETGWYCDGA